MWWLRASPLRGAIRPYRPGGIAIEIPSGTAFLPCGGMEVALGDVRSYPIESGVERLGMYVVPLPLRVDVMWTCRVVELVGLSKLMVVVSSEYNVAVASSKDGGMD